MTTFAELRINGSITSGGYELTPFIVSGVISPGSMQIVEDGVVESGVLSTAAWGSIFPGITGLVDKTVVGIFSPSAEGESLKLGWIRVSIGGAQMQKERTLSWFEMTETDDGAVSWSFGVPYFNSSQTDAFDYGGGGVQTTDFIDPLKPFGAATGSISHYHGPPPGGKSVDIDFVVALPTGVIVIPLVSDGLAENASLVFGEDGATMVVNGTGPMQRLDRKAISIEIPAGHGMTMGEMVTWIMEETRDQNADDWDYTLPTIPGFFVIDENGTLDTRNRYKLIQATDRSGIETAQELLEIVGHRLVLDREGEWRMNRTFDDGDATSWFFNFSDLLSVEGIDLQPNAEGPPVVVFSGSTQEVDDDIDGLITKTTQLWTTGPHTRLRPEFQVTDTSGGLTPTGFVDFEVNGIYYYEEHNNTFRGDTQVGRASRYMEQNINPEARAGSISDTSGTILYVTAQYLYEAEGYVSTHITGHAWRNTVFEYEDWVYEDIFDDGREFLTRKVTRKSVRYNPREAIMTGDGTYRTSTYVLWNGEGVQYTDDSWFADKPSPFSRETIDYVINEDGFIEQETRTMEGANYLQAGTAYYFADGRSSSVTDEDWGTLFVERTTYSIQDDAHFKTIRLYQNGRVISTKVEKGEGYLPAAAMSGTVKPTELADGTPLPNSKWASPNDTNAFEVTYESATLLEHRPRWEDRISNPIVADADEGLTYARRYLRERATIPVLFSIPFNPLLRPTDWIEIDMGMLGTHKLGTVRAKVVSLTPRYDREDGSTLSVEAKVFTV